MSKFVYAVKVAKGIEILKKYGVDGKELLPMGGNRWAVPLEMI